MKKIFYPFITFFLPFIALAQRNFPVAGPQRPENLYNIIKSTMDLVFTFGIIIITIVVIVGLIAYIRARKDKEKSRKVKRIVIYSLIGGAAIIGLVWFLLYTYCSSYMPLTSEKGRCR